MSRTSARPDATRALTLRALPRAAAASSRPSRMRPLTAGDEPVDREKGEERRVRVGPGTRMGVGRGGDHRRIAQAPPRQTLAKLREQARIHPDEVHGEPEQPDASRFEHEAADLDGIVNADGRPEPERVGVPSQDDRAARRGGEIRRSRQAACPGAAPPPRSPRPRREPASRAPRTTVVPASAMSDRERGSAARRMSRALSRRTDPRRAARARAGPSRSA